MKMIFLAFTDQIAANINLNCPSSVVYRKVEFLSQDFIGKNKYTLTL